jgi:hypothetical protein
LFPPIPLYTIPFSSFPIVLLIRSYSPGLAKTGDVEDPEDEAGEGRGSNQAGFYFHVIRNKK